MNEEQAFLREIETTPDDNTHRLVYADWLDDRGDGGRAAYLRAEVELAAQKPNRRKAIEPRRRLMDTRAGLDPVWLARLEQPRVLRAAPVPYPLAWIGTEGEDFRKNTYGYYGGCHYRDLPPLPVELFTGEFRWLGRSSRRESEPADLKDIARQANALSLTLPGPFHTLFRHFSLRQRFRSSTDNFFWLPPRLVPVPKTPGDHLLRFYSDSQGCYHWYLYLAPSGAYCVVGSDHNWLEPVGELTDSQLHFSAPSLEAFLYRVWIENEIWFALNCDNVPLTVDQQVYVNHYRKKK